MEPVPYGLASPSNETFFLNIDQKISIISLEFWACSLLLKPLPQPPLSPFVTWFLVYWCLLALSSGLMHRSGLSSSTPFSFPGRSQNLQLAWPIFLSKPAKILPEIPVDSVARCFSHNAIFEYFLHV